MSGFQYLKYGNSVACVNNDTMQFGKYCMKTKEKNLSMAQFHAFARCQASISFECLPNNWKYLLNKPKRVMLESTGELHFLFDYVFSDELWETWRQKDLAKSAPVMTVKYKRNQYDEIQYAFTIDNVFTHMSVEHVKSRFPKMIETCTKRLQRKYYTLNEQTVQGLRKCIHQNKITNFDDLPNLIATRETLQLEDKFSSFKLHIIFKNAQRVVVGTKRFDVSHEKLYWIIGMVVDRDGTVNTDDLITTASRRFEKCPYVFQTDAKDSELVPFAFLSTFRKGSKKMGLSQTDILEMEDPIHKIFNGNLVKLSHRFNAATIQYFGCFVVKKRP